MESMKKFRIGSGLQNFYVHAPLPDTQTKVLRNISENENFSVLIKMQTQRSGQSKN